MLSSDSTQQQWTIFQLDCDVWWKVDFIWQPKMTSWLNWEEAPKHFPEPYLYQKKSHGHCLVVCYFSVPLQFSESQWNHYIWEVCSTNQWDAMKTAMPAACTGQQNGPNSSPQQCPTTCHTTNTSEVGWNGLQSFAFVAQVCLLYLPDLLSTDYLPLLQAP